MKNIDELFEKLKSEIVGAKGESVFTLNNINVKMTSRDSMGNLLQDWLAIWFARNKVNFKVLPNTQEFPDYIIHFDDEVTNLEIKSWNFDASPAFDLANFEAYIQMIEEDPKKLLATYFVFGYTITDEGEITINDVFKKHIWELTGPSTKRPLTVQVKRGVIYNIRPKNFKNKNVEIFGSAEEFLIAIKNQMIEYNSRKKNMNKWFADIKKELQL